MDFEPTPEQQDAGRLAAQILADRCTQERLQEVERSGPRFDEDLWRRLGDAGLLGLPLPEEYGGAGLGVLELCSVLTEVGRVVAPVPLATHSAAAVTIARFGTADQQATWLPDAVTGRTVLTCALAEDRVSAPEQPGTRAEPDGTRWLLTGTKTVVPAGTVAGLFVVPAATPDGVRTFLVRPGDPGVTVETQVLNDGDVAGRLELDGVRLDATRALGGAGEEVSRSATELATLALCAEQLGVVEGALRLTADYARTREQFGRPIGTFQAVSQRLADGYIDAQGLALTVCEAAWRLSEGLDCGVEIATAKLWAADAAHRVAHTTVHVHGGVGIDLDGAAHRYFTAAKRIELTLGGTTEQARAVGRRLAVEPV